jgi:hypothetical protein
MGNAAPIPTSYAAQVLSGGLRVPYNALAQTLQRYAGGDVPAATNLIGLRVGMRAAALPVGGGVASVTIGAGGSGYASPPTVTFGAPTAGGRTAKGTATINAGAVTGVVISDPGTGYLTPPSVGFSGGGGTGASGTAVLQSGWSSPQPNPGA